MSLLMTSFGLPEVMILLVVISIAGKTALWLEEKYQEKEK
tara:strand:- start:832 stop:951 length:120 start_codon:yes stop_codon:yes gene_type:complete